MARAAVIWFFCAWLGYAVFARQRANHRPSLLGAGERVRIAVRLVDAARIEGGSSDRMAVSFGFGEKRATFELKASSVRNPLRLPELARLRCPA